MHSRARLILIGLAVTLAGCGADETVPIAAAPPSPGVETPAPDGGSGPEGTGAAQLAAAQSRDLFFVGLFFRKFDSSVRRAERSLIDAVAATQGRAEYARVDLALAGQDAIIKRLDLERIPLPAVLIVAPGGSVTRTFLISDSAAIDKQVVLSALVTRAHADVLAAFQAGKLAVVDMRPPLTPMERTIDPIELLFLDATASANLVRVTIDPTDPAELTFLAQFKDESLDSKPTLLVLAAPGKEIGRLTGEVTRDGVLEIVKRGAAP